MTMKRHLVVDLDALLDTRLTTLEEFFDEDTIFGLLQSGQYHARLVDKFLTVGKETFGAAYARRGTKQIANAVLTNVVFLLRKLVLEMMREKINEPFRDNPEVLVNFYPYEIPVDFMVSFCDTLRFKLTHDENHLSTSATKSLKVNWVNIPPEALTPQYCQQNQYGVLIKYDGLKWFETHIGSLIEKPLKDLILIAPALYVNQDPDTPEVKALLESDVNPLGAVREMANQVMTLNLIDAEHFSVVGFKNRQPVSTAA